MDIRKYLGASLSEKYEFFNYNHAIEIISQAFSAEWQDICDALNAFALEVEDLSDPGGSETRIPSKFDNILYPRKWRNVKITGDLHLKFYERIVDQKKYEDYPSADRVIGGYITGQHVDYLKGRIALGLEWNKKDLAFDRVLTSFRTFYDCNLISAAVIITRSADLNSAFKEIFDTDGKPIARKYGSSSTWIGKLLPRLDSRQAGGCPILVVGIKSKCIKGY